MSGIDPWVSVEPNKNPAALLGHLPTKVGTVHYPIPTSVVPADATGILVFSWFSSTGSNCGLAYWHMAVNVGGGRTNWFPLLIYGDPSNQDAISYNSQAFWLPMPIDGMLYVTLLNRDVPDGDNQGTVEIHGYYPGSQAAVQRK